MKRNNKDVNRGVEGFEGLFFGEKPLKLPKEPKSFLDRV